MNAVERIRQLYEWDPEARDNLRMIHYTSIDSFLKNLEKDPPRDFSMETLDAYKSNMGLSLDLAIVLAFIPAEVIHRELGDDALIWTWVQYVYSTQRMVIAKGIQRVTGRDPERLNKARLTAWQLLHTNQAGVVRAIYNLNEAILGRITDSIDLSTLLQENAGQGVQMSGDRLKQYSLDPLTTEADNSHGYEFTWGSWNNQSGDKRYSIFLDSPVGVTLKYKGDPNAIIGFFPSNVETLMIYQIQGVRPTKIGEDGKPIGKGSSRGLMPLDWQKLLVSVVRNIGQQLGYSQIGIQSGNNNRWTKPYGKNAEIHLPLEEALKKYDALAERLGFQQAENMNWYRRLG